MKCNENDLSREQRVVELTADGSATIYLPALDEHYHSVKGALTESEHIFRDCAYLHRAAMRDKSTLRLLEIGFGTGLNAAVTAMAATDDSKVHYHTMELYPLTLDEVTSLGYGKLLDPELLQRLHLAQWNTAEVITPHFTLEKMRCDLLTTQLPSDIDVVYFDAFAPEKQPEMWSGDVFERLYAAMACGGVLTTYCAKGAVRRLFESVGFSVERLAGPPGGKREILRATKIMR